MKKSILIKGNICQTKNPQELDLHEKAFAVCVFQGTSEKKLPYRQVLPPQKVTALLL